MKLKFVPIVVCAVVLVWQPLAVSAAESALPALVKAVSATDDARFQLDVLRGISQALEGSVRADMPEGWEALEEKLSGSTNAEVRSLVRSLGLKFGSENALNSLRETLAGDGDAAEREKALAALLAARDPRLPELLLRVIETPALRGAAIRALATYNQPGTPDALLKVFGELSDGERRDALNTLVSRGAYAAELLQAVEAGTVPREALTAELVRQIRTFKDADLMAAVERVWGSVRESNADKQAEIEKYKQVYWAGGSTPGDASRGRLVYSRICQQCHTLFDVGGQVGPDLTGSNRGDLDYILQNMVDPNAVIPNEYRSATVETKDDRVLTGILKRQDNNSVTVQTANDTVVIPRAEIASIQQGELSMMPEGLLEALTEQEVRDLIYYLRQPAQAPLPESEQAAN